MARRQRGDGAAEPNGKDPLARSLGWFSLALGTTQIALPGVLARALALGGDNEHSVLMRALGVRELASGIGILARRRPAGWLWARVAGDAIDLALLGAAESKRQSRVAAAAAAVAGVMVPDLVASARLTSDGGPNTVTKAITVNRASDEVYRFWRDFDKLPGFMTHLESVQVTGDRRSRWRAKGPAGRSVEWDAEIVTDRPGELIAWRSLPGGDIETSGSVRFSSAPGRRGTEVTVELTYSPPAGSAGATIAKLLGEEPATQAADDLRRFKQVIETGEIVRSEATPGGHALMQHLKQRPAQPLPHAEGGDR
ncbi:MAG: SRPBCC family protein [Actinomycetota bacterium]|nr:SRPBCC family protein [Actinomycetota bacterium]